MVSTLLELLNGYYLMIQIHSMVQGAAFDAEDELNWALDWSAGDEDNPRFGGFDWVAGAGDEEEAGGEFAVGVRIRTLFNPLRMRSVASERLARRQHGAVACKRYVIGADGSRRLYDGVGTGKRPSLAKGCFMEVKSGSQSLTLRVRRQIDRDRAYIENRDIKGVLWEFHQRKGDRIAPELLDHLRNSGIQWRITVIP